MSAYRGCFAILVPLLLAVIVIGQHYYAWVPESRNGFHPWRVVNIALAIWLLYAALNSGEERSARHLGEVTVECLACGAPVTIGHWEGLGHCPLCGHPDYEYARPGRYRHAQFLPGAVKLAPPAPPPEPPTPLAKPPTQPPGPVRQVVDRGLHRVSARAKRRVRERLDRTIEQRESTLRV